jgi:hypothetical protein
MERLREPVRSLGEFHLKAMGAPWGSPTAGPPPGAMFRPTARSRATCPNQALGDKSTILWTDPYAVSLAFLLSAITFCSSSLGISS